jgi:hypothetical protein
MFDDVLVTSPIVENSIRSYPVLRRLLPVQGSQYEWSTRYQLGAWWGIHPSWIRAADDWCTSQIREPQIFTPTWTITRLPEELLSQMGRVEPELNLFAGDTVEQVPTGNLLCIARRS